MRTLLPTRLLTPYKLPTRRLSTSLLATSLLFSVQSQANNWTDFHGLTEPTSLPQHFSEHTYSITSTAMIVADLHINLSDVLSDPLIGSKKPTSIVIVADTISVPNHFLLPLKNQSLFIFARQINGEGNGTITLDSDPQSNEMVGIFTQELTASLSTLAIQSDGHYDLTPLQASPLGQGQLITQLTGQHQTQHISGDLSGYLQLNLEGYQTVFEKSFDMAASMYDQDPTLSLNMLSWLESHLRLSPTVLQDNPFIANLYLQTANLKQFIEFSSQSENYVPYLDRQLYQATYASYLDTMQDYQSQYERFVDQSKTANVRKVEAELMLDNMEDAIRAEAAIADQAVLNITELENALANIKQEFSAQESSVFSARSAFLIGLENWKTKQELQVALEVFTAVSSIGSAMAGAFVGNVEGLNSLAADIPDTAVQLTELALKIKLVAGVLEKVTGAVNGMASLTTTVKRDLLYDKVADSFENLTFNIPSLHESNNAWEVLLIDVRSHLRWASSLGVVGAAGYLAELEKLIVYGKSINAIQIDIAQEQSRLVELLIAAEVNKNHLTRIESLLANIEDEQSALLELETLFYRNLNSLKRPMFVALANYEAAFRYWGLNESQVSPSLNKDYLEYKLDLATLDDEYTQALNRFTPSPQNFYINSIEITDPQQLADFAADGSLSVHISQEHSAFSLFDRVRLSTIRVVLQGSQLPINTDYFIDIESNGEYQDRWQDNEYTFNANPLYRLFGYELLDTSPTSNQYNLITDGSIADQFSFAYFEPTPFSTWSFSLREPSNIDLSLVDSIHIEFMGNAIPKN
ncbi:hypothetical protein [uncultured Shewanella sp.]|uniref:hypothetical protein n=1 Tax=uncultured Shewanella sp. TaxID=173975 RepID=UPI0026317EBC|nr:hypothetical protein [uncultured Shewanella sp.]